MNSIEEIRFVEGKLAHGQYARDAKLAHVYCISALDCDVIYFPETPALIFLKRWTASAISKLYKPFFLHVIFVKVFYHSNKNETRTLLRFKPGINV